jgi:hypothetical protein
MISPRTSRQETAMGPISVQDFKPSIGDGKSHPLSERYATLAAAQAEYPFVTSLAQEIDWAAIQKALWFAGDSADPRGTTVLVPRGDYCCGEEDLRISRQVRFAGMGRAATTLSFGPGAGIMVDNRFTSPDGGEGTYGTIADLDIIGTKVPGIEQWQPGKLYVAGNKAKGILPGRVYDRNDNRFYYECIKAGRSLETAKVPKWNTPKLYNAGDVVRVGKPIYFKCIAVSGDGKSGPDEPVWALPTDETTWDGKGAESHELVDYLLWQRLIPADDPEQSPLELVNRGAWKPNWPQAKGDVAYAVGDVVEATAEFTSRLFFRSKNGTSAGDHEPAWEAEAPGELTKEATALLWERGVLTSRMPLVKGRPWEPGRRYEVGEVVQSREKEGVLQGRLFECTGAGISGPGPGEPAWKTVPGGTTPDGAVTWTCRQSPSAFTDGTVEWVCKASPGIWLRTQAYVQNVLVKGFTNAGIHIQSQEWEWPHHYSNNVDHWQVYNALVHSCGLGVLVMGTDSQAGTAIGCEIMDSGYDTAGRILPRGNGGTGVYDRGNGANNWIGCATEGNAGRAFVAATSNAASRVLGCYIEDGQQPSYLGYAAFKIGSVGDNAPNSEGWIVNDRQHVGPFAVPNTIDSELVFHVGYKSTDPTILYAWERPIPGGKGKEIWVFRWDDEKQVWRTGADQTSGFPPANYFTGFTHPRGPFLQGFPSLLLGDPWLLAPPQGPIKVGAYPAAYPAKPPWPGEPGDIVFNSAQDEAWDSTKPRYAGWICIDRKTPEWMPFGRIEKPGP